ncbi:DUF3562 domain-containing protein [Usitatibacter palustris]|uniref:DUF3562 domain-containing protein n=1 Tax=Usitatibacter palustris TaxID=2732487 RepID=A0A6M4H6B8_9PROT|nr:DUF3562 domain-containing protein [Usitatibacter palustris]QJR14203.1 hypothetical protein DSM104440_00996 [Usitatibacter palustris]
MRTHAQLIESQTQRLIAEIAARSHHPLEEVREIYEAEFTRLDGQARVKSFLPIFAARSARKILAAH